ncbi:MAG: BatD family protein, partial [Candidatus Omnitrophica bacterium]|nr:BatD family protein [Candidatus Omnitrophota bacterium]
MKPAVGRTTRPLGFVFLMLFMPLAGWAEVAIETSVDRARVAVGEELTLDIIITNAEGPISKPVISQIEGFASYSQGHSQELTIVNGKSSSRSIFSYVLMANSVGKKTIGPFEISIGGKLFKVGAVQVEVVPDGSNFPASAVSQGPVTAPPVRALPQGSVSSQDIFVKAWLDRDEVTVNEPAILTYTLYTRLSATYKGFEKEPSLTGFWVEDFPPEKTLKRTEQIFNNSRYVVADVRKIALFPTEPGVFTLDSGVIASTVEVSNQDDFDSFFSYNVFGGRRTAIRSPILREVVARSLPTDPVTLVAKTLPEAGKPASFKGAVGQYTVESSVDKSEIDQGNPITYRLKIAGQGNIHTLEPPTLPKIEGFKMYDSS